MTGSTMFGILKRKEQMEKGLKKARQTLFPRIAEFLNGPKLDSDTWDTLQEVLITADVGVATATELVGRVRARVQEERISDATVALDILKEEMVRLLDTQTNTPQWFQIDTFHKPLVIMLVGVNGVGKTTGIAKLAQHFRNDGKRIIIAAADTFRAAAVDQLRVWGKRVGVDVVAHEMGSDPGAVAYDAYQAAVARDADVLLVDTAGRLHTKNTLMDELRKVDRVLKRLVGGGPNHTVLVLDATTGHNGLTQAKHFTEAVGCDGVFLTKLDGTAKGGIVVAIAHELLLPVLFVGTGEGLEDLSLFDARDFVDLLFTPMPGYQVPGALQ